MATTKITGTGLGLPTADGAALGGASNEWSDLYLADGSVIYFGADQDVTLTHDPDDGLFLKSIATTDNNPVLLTLQTGETDIAADDVIGKISFQAPDEGTGTDAVLVAAAIQARSEGDFAADANATSIDFMVGSSEAAATKMTLNSIGNLLIGDGTSSLPSLTNTGDLNTGIYFPAADQVGVTVGGTEVFRFGSNPIPSGSKNLIDNGAMVIAQRGAGGTCASVAADSTFGIDRYSNRLIGGGPARWNVVHDTTVPAGKGFGYSMKIDVTTIDSSISGSDYHGITATIEAQRLQHLNYNNAAALPCVLTFWARAKKAGLHGGAVYNNDANRSLVFSWTAVSDEWQKVTVPVPGDTSGAINNDNGAGLTIYWSLSGGKFTASDTDAWVAGAYLSVTSAVNDFDHVDNDFYLTGVQLEVGEVATDYDHEHPAATLQKCQRFYQHWGDPKDGAGDAALTGVCRSTTSAQIEFGMFTTEMRAAPTMTWSTVNCIDSSASGVDGTISTGTTGRQGVSASVSGTGFADGNGIVCELKASSNFQASAEL